MSRPIYVEHVGGYTKDKKFYSMKQAAAYAVQLDERVRYNVFGNEHDDCILIHTGGMNLDYVHQGDTVESVRERCLALRKQLCS